MYSGVQHQKQVEASAGTKALAAMQQLSVASLPPISPELLHTQSTGAAFEVDTAIADMLNMESLPALETGTRQALASTVATPTISAAVAAGPQASGVASSPLPASSSTVKEGTEADAETCPESDDGSESSTVMCDRCIRHEVLDCRAGSSMWRLPSDSALLSFASCMAA